MKKVRVIPLITMGLMLLLSTPAQSQFANALGGSSNDYGYRVIQTPDGGFVVTGYTNSFGAGGSDLLLSKFDSLGNHLWSTTLGGASLDEGRSLAQTSDGGLMVTGSTGSFGVGGTDLLLCKFDSSGNHLWSKTLGGTSSDYGRSVIQTPDGGFVVTGYTSSFGAGNNDLLLCRFDASGNHLWSLTAGGTMNEFGEDVVQTSDGGFVTIGTTGFGVDSWDLLLCKFDSSGNLLWSRTLGESLDEKGKSVVQTSDSGLVIAGLAQSYTKDSSHDVLLSKFDALGNHLWSRVLGDASWDEGNSVVQTVDGGLVITGYRRDYDILLSKFDASGNHLWSRLLWNQSGYSVLQTPDSGFVVAGSGYGAGGSDLFLLKFDPGNDSCSGRTELPPVQSISPTVTSTTLTVTSFTPIITSPNPTVTSPQPTITDVCNLYPPPRCPEDPNDNGICDTLHVNIFPPDTLFTGPGQLVRVPMFVTHDVPNDAVDSISGMVIPLCYTHTNPAKYCSLTAYWNNLSLSGSDFARSIFRTIGNDTTWMKELYDDPNGPYDWTGKMLDLDGTSYFWLGLYATTQPLLGTVNHKLTATMTFRVEDTMTIYIDTCFWSPSSHLAFSRMDSVSYVPRDNMPYSSLEHCPEDPRDNGICDTLHVNIFPPDTLFTGPGHLVRVPIYVTHDIPNHALDSIAGMAIPLFYTHTNPAKYCSLTNYWNTTAMTGTSFTRSVFKTLGTETTWMKEFYDDINGPFDWTCKIVSLDGTSHFWLMLIPTTQPLLGTVNHKLTATMTFRVEDTTTICLDSCLWPPSSRLAFSRMDAVNYVPRDNMPYCFSLSYPAIGDMTADGVIDLGDVVYLTSYLYRGGPPPNPLWLGDTNCDGVVELGDRVQLGNYVYRGGSPPCSP